MTTKDYYHQKALLELEQCIRERCLNRVVKNDGAELKQLFKEVCTASDVTHSGNFVFTVTHYRAERILIFTEPVNGNEEYIRIMGYNITPKTEPGMTPVLKATDIGDADKELVEFAQTIDFTELYQQIKASARIVCRFDRPRVSISKGSVYIEFISENICCQTGPFSAILKRCYIHSFSNGVVRDENTGEPRYWVSVDIRYEHKDGGENGMEMGRALYSGGKWEFMGSQWARQHENQKNSRLLSSLF